MLQEEQEILEWFEIQNYLEEKLIMVNKGKKSGQIIFLAGGAGSGKGFVIKNFLNNTDFKVRDVDEWKIAFLKIAQQKKKYPEITGLDLKKPKDVFDLHMFVKQKGVKEKTLDNLLNDVKQDRLPNIIFDVTLKDVGDITDTIPRLLSLGYEPRNISIIWVLTNVYTAIENNSNRDRVVPDDILLKTHEGASKTMQEIIKGQIPRGVDGEIHVVLNNKEETVFWIDPKTAKRLKRDVVVKKFTSIKMKDAGKPIRTEKEVQSQVFDWISKNAPKDELTMIRKTG